MAAARATSVPRPPMATPMFASFRARASLIPSPVMATTSPRLFRACTSRCLWIGITRAKMLAPATRRESSLSSRFSSSSPVTIWSSSCSSPIDSAMLWAVRGWSPVIMITRIPASRHAARECFTSGRGGSLNPTRPRKVRSRSFSSRLPERAGSGAEATAMTRIPTPASRSFSLLDLLQVPGPGAAAPGDSLHGPLGGDHQAARVVLPDVGHDLRPAVEGIVPHHLPPRVGGPGGHPVLPGVLQQDLLQRVGGVHLAGEDDGFPETSAVLVEVLRHGQLPLGEGPRLVGADHRRGSQRLHSHHPPHQGLLAGEPRDAQREVEGEDDGELLGNGGDGKAHGGEEGLLPARSPEDLDGHEEEAGHRRSHRQAGHQDADLPLQGSALLLDLGHLVADLPVLGGPAGGLEKDAALPVEHPRSGEDPRAGGIRRLLRDGDRFSGERGLVHLHVAPLHQEPVGGKDVALLDEDPVPGDQILHRDLLRLPVPQDAGGGKGHRPDCLQRPPGARLQEEVHHEDGDDGEDQDPAVADLSQEEVDGGRHEEQQRHGIGQGLQPAQQGAQTGLRDQKIGAVNGRGGAPPRRTSGPRRRGRPGERPLPEDAQEWRNLVTDEGGVRQDPRPGVAAILHETGGVQAWSLRFPARPGGRGIQDALSPRGRTSPRRGGRGSRRGSIPSAARRAHPAERAPRGPGRCAAARAAAGPPSPGSPSGRRGR